MPDQRPQPPSAPTVMLKVVRHDRNEQVLAECESPVVPERGEAIRLDMLDERGQSSGPSTLWRVVSVTLHIPSLRSLSPADGTALRVRHVEVAVLPDVTLVPEFSQAAAQILSESKM